jgi:hypothetical protein
MRLQQFRHIGRYHRDRIADADAALRQRRSEPAAALVELAVSVTPVAVDHRYLVRVDIGCPLQKTKRRERHKVGGIPVKLALENIDTFSILAQFRFLHLRDSAHSASECS